MDKQELKEKDITRFSKEELKTILANYNEVFDNLYQDYEQVVFKDVKEAIKPHLEVYVKTLEDGEIIDYTDITTAFLDDIEREMAEKDWDIWAIVYEIANYGTVDLEDVAYDITQGIVENLNYSIPYNYNYKNAEQDDFRLNFNLFTKNQVDTIKRIPKEVCDWAREHINNKTQYETPFLIAYLMANFYEYSDSFETYFMEVKVYDALKRVLVSCKEF